MSTVSTDRVARMFVEFADSLVEGFDVLDFLQTLTTRTVELVDSAAAGLLLADEGGVLQFVAASDERAHLLELFQVQAVEGPCQDCFRMGTPVVNADLTAAHELWHVFAPRALSAGFRSVHAFPLRLRRDVVGALNMFGTEPGTLATTDIAVVQALADVATIALLQEKAVREANIVSQQLAKALSSRIVIEQAKGALAQIHGESVDDAFDRLRRYARSSSRPLSTVALEVLNDPEGVPALTQPRARVGRSPPSRC